MTNIKTESQSDFEHTQQSLALKTKLASHPYGSNPDYPEDLRYDVDGLIDIISQEFARVIQQIEAKATGINVVSIFTVYRETRRFENSSRFIDYAFCKSHSTNRLDQSLRYDDVLHPMLYEFSHIAWCDAREILNRFEEYIPEQERTDTSRFAGNMTDFF